MLFSLSHLVKILFWNYWVHVRHTMFYWKCRGWQEKLPQVLVLLSKQPKICVIAQVCVTNSVIIKIMLADSSFNSQPGALSISKFLFGCLHFQNHFSLLEPTCSQGSSLNIFFEWWLNCKKYVQDNMCFWYMSVCHQLRSSVSVEWCKQRLIELLFLFHTRKWWSKSW